MSQNIYPELDSEVLVHNASSLSSLEVTPHAILARQDVPELQELVLLRKTGWDDERLTTHFSELRKVADNPDERQASFWYKRMQSVMRELDLAGNFVHQRKQIEFLDIGSAPGGFSSYILRKNKLARGVGITLPVTSGGYISRLDNALLPRYEQIEEDVLEYDLSPPHLDELPGCQRQLPATLFSRFSLVVLDGHAIRTYPYPVPTPTPEDMKAAHGVYRDSLLVAQLIIALEAVRPGGTIVTRLSHIECFPSAHLLYLLDSLSDSLVLCKPRVVHASRGTCYAIAKGVCKPGNKFARERARWLVALRALWHELVGGGPMGRGRMMVPGDLDFMVTAEVILGEYLERLVALGRDVWATQVEGLRELFERKGTQ